MKCFPCTLRRRNLKTEQSPVILDLCSVEENLSTKSHDYRDVIIFEKLLFKNVLSPDENEEQAFSSFSGLKSVFKKRRFHDRLVRTVALTVERKLRFLRVDGAHTIRVAMTG